MADLDSLFGKEHLDEHCREAMLHIDTFVIRILKPTEDKALAEDFQKTKMVEVNDLKGRGLWKRTSEKDRDKNGITIGERFILTLKHYGMSAEKKSDT